MIERIDFLAVATLVAVLFGPVLAVLVTRFLDKAASSKRRKFDIFRNLMQTRGVRLDPLHVASLNLIEVEFYGKQNVLSPFKSYISHLSSPMPDVKEQERYFEQRADLFMDLLAALGNELGYRFDKRELERNSYVPQGWDTDQALHRRNAHLLSQILSGNAAVPVTNVLSQTSPYPEPPEINERSG